VTYYHPLTFTGNLESKTAAHGDRLPGILELEASRFTALNFDEKIFQTETGAVLGEYRKLATDPSLLMEEKLLELMYPNHPYGHTTMGYYQDVVEMPKHYEYARWFYDTYYRPNNCVLIVAGDVKEVEMMPKLRKAFGAWERKEAPPVQSEAPRQTEEKRGHVAWDADVPPRVSVVYKAPAFKTGTREAAVGIVLPELLTSESAPLYRKLRFQKKTVSSLRLNPSEYTGFDVRPMACGARLYPDLYKNRGMEYLDEVVRDVIGGFEELKSFSKSTDAAMILETVKSKLKYDFLAGLDSPASVAETFALYYRFERDPDVLNKILQSVEDLSASDIDAYATTFFTAENRVVVTMSPK
jgi:zinc protease